MGDTLDSRNVADATMHSPEEQQRLIESWAVTTAYLRTAEQQLAEEFAATDVSATREFNDWLDHNELELALDQLENMGSDSRSPIFWSSLLAAAENMDLQSHAARYRLHLAALR